jgi:hypothetical protein
MISLTFADAEFTRPSVGRDYDLLLGVEATFSLAVNSEIIYVEPMFTIVELRLALEKWLATDPKPGFDLISMESDERGLIWFHQQKSGLWCAGSVFQDHAETGETPLSELVSECQRFVDSVDSWVREELQLEVRDVLAI